MLPLTQTQTRSDVELGIVAWLVAAVHEIPQELGDFGVLVRPAGAVEPRSPSSRRA
jgi:hypothetical protein